MGWVIIANVRIAVAAMFVGMIGAAAADPDAPRESDGSDDHGDGRGDGHGDDRGDGRIEASGFVGATYFASDIGLGNSMYAEQRPRSSPLVGARLTIIAWPSLVGDAELHLDLGIEAEVALAAAFTGDELASGRSSYFAPVFDWRGDLMIRAGGGKLSPHVTIGGGGASVRSSSPYMTKETLGELVYGLGGAYTFAGGWKLRVDIRHGLITAQAGGLSSSFEAAIGIGGVLARPHARALVRRVEPAPPSPPTELQPEARADLDRDGDGIPDRLDRCPDEPETVNGFEDADGCPDTAPIATAPELDRDHDGIPDERDACPDEPETVNGYQDNDGCPDALPAELAPALAAAAAVRFDPGKARVTDAAKQALAPAAAVLRAHPALRITLTVHHTPSDRSDDLAAKRGDAIKWALRDEGVAADQIAIVISAAPAPTPISLSPGTVEKMSSTPDTPP